MSRRLCRFKIIYNGSSGSGDYWGNSIDSIQWPICDCPHTQTPVTFPTFNGSQQAYVLHLPTDPQNPYSQCVIIPCVKCVNGEMYFQFQRSGGIPPQLTIWRYKISVADCCGQTIVRSTDFNQSNGNYTGALSTVFGFNGPAPQPNFQSIEIGTANSLSGVIGIDCDTLCPEPEQSLNQNLNQNQNLNLNLNRT